ncbi:MAG: RidA family protein [Chloroflexota bacterium]|nr:RidA family protein [Chloroflexota bacterium]
MQRREVRGGRFPVASFTEGPGASLSLATQYGNLLFLSGMGPIDPATKTVPSQDIRTQIRITLTNLRQALEGSGSSLTNVLKVNCYLRNPTDFQAYNEVYAEFFKDGFPARTTVIAAPPRSDVHVAIEAIAFIAEAE